MYPCDIGEALVEEALVGRHGVIAVHAVFDQELPVRLHAVGLRARHDLGVLTAQFEHQVEIFAGVAEIENQAFDSRIEADEHHPAIAFETRHRLEAERVGVEGGRIGIVARDRG